MAKGAKQKVQGGGAPDRKNSALNDEETRALLISHHVPAYEKALKAKKQADADMRNFGKRLKADGFELSDVKDAIKARTDEGAKEILDEIQRLLRTARWANIPVGEQTDMFEDKRSTEERAFESGKMAGMQGTSTNENPYSGPDGQKWMEGWQEGQKLIFNIQEKKVDPDAGGLISNRDSEGPDEFDEAADDGQSQTSEESEDTEDA